MEASQLPNYSFEDRPWGSFERFTLNEPTTVKILTLKAGESTSLQTHTTRREFWRILSGRGAVLIGDMHQEAIAGNAFMVPQGAVHRLEGGAEGMSLIEIAFGHFDENDITRIEDKYHRV